MEHKQFSIREALIFGARKTIVHWLIFLKILVLVFVTLALLSALMGVLFGVVASCVQLGSGIEACKEAIRARMALGGSIVGAILTATGMISIGFLVKGALYLGANRVALDIHDRGESACSRMWLGWKVGIGYFFISLLYLGIMLSGFLLLIIPGLIWMIKYSFYDLLMADTHRIDVGLFAESASLTAGVKLKLVLFMIVAGLLNAFTFNLTFPITLMARVHIYRCLSSYRARQ